MFCQQGLAQKSKQKSQTEETYHLNRVSYVSVKQDTLILPNDALGKLIHDTWNDTPKDKQPIILFADAMVIHQKNQMSFVSTKRTPRIKN